MTDRFHSLTVFLETDMREDDAEALLAAIRCLRGVQMVVGEVADPGTLMAEVRAKSAMRAALLHFIKTETAI